MWSLLRDRLIGATGGGWQNRGASTVRVNNPNDNDCHLDGVRAGKKLGRGSSFRCLLSGSAISGNFTKTERREEKIPSQLLAATLKGSTGRVYVDVDDFERVVFSAGPTWSVTQESVGK